MSHRKLTTGWVKNWALAGFAVALPLGMITAAALTLTSSVTPVAHAAGGVTPDTHTYMYLSNGGFDSFLGAKGAGNPPVIVTDGTQANLTIGNCGNNASGQPVRAWNNQNGLYVHAKTGGVVTMEHDSTNGCSNNADEWIDVGGGVKWQNKTYGCLLWASNDTQNSVIKCSNASGGYFNWTGGGA